MCGTLWAGWKIEPLCSIMEGTSDDSRQTSLSTHTYIVHTHAHMPMEMTIRGQFLTLVPSLRLSLDTAQGGRKVARPWRNFCVLPVKDTRSYGISR